MTLSSDIRYTTLNNERIAVAFDGNSFMAYAVGSEYVGVTISMEMLVGIYPEVAGKSLKRTESSNANTSPFGMWVLDGADAPIQMDALAHNWSDLQERAHAAIQEHRGRSIDIIATLERTVERLDILLEKTKQPSAWAEVLLPVLEAARNEGISMDDILEAGYNKLRWLENENAKAKK